VFALLPYSRFIISSGSMRYAAQYPTPQPSKRARCKLPSVHWSAISLWLPQLDGIAFGVMQPSKSAIRVQRGIDFDHLSGCTKLGYHGVEIVDSEVDHPSLIHSSEVFGVLRKRSEGGGSGFLDPGLLTVVRGHEVYSQLFLVPTGQTSRIVGAEEEASNSGNVLHWDAGCRWGTASEQTAGRNECGRNEAEECQFLIHGGANLWQC